MGAPVNNTPSPQAVAPSSASASTAGAAASTNATAEMTGATKISSLDDLKKKAPEVYNQMMLSVATTMITSMKRQQEHLKKMWKEAREKAQA